MLEQLGGYVPIVLTALGGAVGSYLAVRVELAVLRTRVDQLEQRVAEVRGELHSVRGALYEHR